MNLDQKIKALVKGKLHDMAAECGVTRQAIHAYVVKNFGCSWSDLSYTDQERVARKYYLQKLGFNIPLNAAESLDKLQQGGQYLIEGFIQFAEECARTKNYKALSSMLTPATIEAMIALNVKKERETAKLDGAVLPILQEAKNDE